MAQKLEASQTHLFFRLELILDLRAKDRQKNAATQWQPEDFRVYDILNALHFPLSESSGGDFRDNFDDEIAG